MTVVTIIDYGIGNLLSVTRAFENCGAEVFVSKGAEGIEKAEYLVLPGVGAFADGMKGLREHGLVEPIKRYVAAGKPFLGICLGMQMMMDSSEEFGDTEGLGLIPGKVVAIPRVGTNGVKHKIPHIGWNEIYPSPPGSWESSIFMRTQPGTPVYFVHSFAAEPELREHRLADCHLNGLVVAAAVRNGNISGCQFHPEKSGQAGLQIIQNFIRLD